MGFEAAFFAGDFLATVFFTAAFFFAGDFLAAAFFGLFLAGDAGVVAATAGAAPSVVSSAFAGDAAFFFDAVFFAAGFLGEAFLGEAFFTVFLGPLAAFFAGDFFTPVFLGDLALAGLLAEDSTKEDSMAIVRETSPRGESCQFGKKERAQFPVTV